MTQLQHALSPVGTVSRLFWTKSLRPCTGPWTHSHSTGWFILGRKGCVRCLCMHYNRWAQWEFIDHKQLWTGPLRSRTEIRNTYVLGITFIFDRCRRSSAAVAPVKNKCDSNNLRGTFSRTKILLTDKLTNRALVTPILYHLMLRACLILQFTCLHGTRIS